MPVGIRKEDPIEHPTQGHRQQTQRETDVDRCGKNVQQQLRVLRLEMLKEIFRETVRLMPLHKAGVDMARALLMHDRDLRHE